eukprot:2578492-Pyramimonas_sp.AAC.1
MLAMSWGSIMSTTTTIWRVWLYTVLPDELAIAHTSAEQLHAAFVWSCEVMLRGVYPDADHEGKPWPMGSRREELAGKLIAGSG